MMLRMYLQEFDCLPQFKITKKRMFKKTATFHLVNFHDFYLSSFQMI